VKSLEVGRRSRADHNPQFGRFLPNRQTLDSTGVRGNRAELPPLPRTPGGPKCSAGQPSAVGTRDGRQGTTGSLADERGRFHVAGDDARWVAARRRGVAISPATTHRMGAVPSREESALSHARPCEPLDPRAEACAGMAPVRSGQGRLLQGAHLVSVPMTVRGWLSQHRLATLVGLCDAQDRPGRGSKPIGSFPGPLSCNDGGPAGPPP
jgi:hypothetical protein